MDRWKSPIDLEMLTGGLITKMHDDLTGCIIEACMKMGINIDKEELLQALEYDRGQYEKGFDDGIKARDEEIAQTADMGEMIKALIAFEQARGVTPSIRLHHIMSSEYISIRFEKNGKCINREFYYGPVGDSSGKSLEMFHPCFNVEIDGMIEELNSVGERREDGKTDA